MGEKTVPIPVRVLVSGFGVLEQFAVASVAQEMVSQASRTRRFPGLSYCLDAVQHGLSFVKRLFEDRDERRQVLLSWHVAALPGSSHQCRRQRKRVQVMLQTNLRAVHGRRRSRLRFRGKDRGRVNASAHRALRRSAPACRAPCRG